MRAEEPASAEVFRVDPKPIARLRHRYTISLYLGSACLGGYFIVPPLLVYVIGHYVALPPGVSMNPPIWLAAGVGVIAIVGFVMFSDYRRRLQINRVAVTETGLDPPFKPRARLTKEDWFVPYGDITSMKPSPGRAATTLSAYDVALRDGFTFQLSPWDLLMYIRPPEIHRYEGALRVIHDEIGRPENQAKATRGEKVIIPRERFRAVLAGRWRRH